MDTFDALMAEVSRSSDASGIAFDEALAAALTDTDNTAENNVPASRPQEPPSTSDTLMDEAGSASDTGGVQTFSLLSDEPQSNAGYAGEDDTEAGDDSEPGATQGQTEQVNIEPEQCSDPVLLITLNQLMTALRAVMPCQITASLAMDGWAADEESELSQNTDADVETSDETETDGGCCSYRFEHPIFATNTRVDVHVDKASAAVALEAGLYETDTCDGYVLVHAMKRPEADISVTFEVTHVLQWKDNTSIRDMDIQSGNISLGMLL